MSHYPLYVETGLLAMQASQPPHKPGPIESQA